MQETIRRVRYAVIERASGFDMPWYFDGAGWSSEPTYYFSNQQAADRHAAACRAENDYPVYTYSVEAQPAEVVV